MNRLLFNALLLLSFYFLYKWIFSKDSNSIDIKDVDPSAPIATQTQGSQQQMAEKKDNIRFENRNPDEILVKVGNKEVPLSKLSKPHAVVHPEDHQPQHKDPNTFPDVEPEAKQKEEQKAFDQAILEPGKQGQKFDADSFPDVEPEAKEREEELAAARAKKND